MIKCANLRFAPKKPNKVFVKFSYQQFKRSCLKPALLPDKYSCSPLSNNLVFLRHHFKCPHISVSRLIFSGNFSIPTLTQRRCLKNNLAPPVKYPEITDFLNPNRKWQQQLIFSVAVWSERSRHIDFRPVEYPDLYRI
jgi:hypothetical protein